MRAVVLMAMAAALVGPARAKQVPASPPTPAQSAQIEKAATSTGTIATAHLTLPRNNPGIEIEVVAADGTKAAFLITGDTLIAKPDGSYEKFDTFRTAPIELFHKKVELRFAPIAESPHKSHVGKNGVLWMRFL